MAVLMTAQSTATLLPPSLFNGTPSYFSGKHSATLQLTHTHKRIRAQISCTVYNQVFNRADE